jgi:hypothetical protein
VTTIEAKVKSLKEELDMMERYLELKQQQRDWHGVADAAMDIREIEAQLRVLAQHGN